MNIEYEIVESDIFEMLICIYNLIFIRLLYL